MIHFTESVGVAPGTTTMTLGKPVGGDLVCLGGACPPDPVRYYTNPPNAKTGWSSGATGPTTKRVEVSYDPYATESQLRSGLQGLVGARLGVSVIAAVVAFAGVLGYGFWKRRR